MANKIEDVQLKAMISFIDNASSLPKDERVRDAYYKVYESMKTGYDNMADNEEKKAWLNYVLADQCYRLGFYLWRHQLASPEDTMWKDLFSFMLPEEALDIARAYAAGDAEQDAELSKKHMEIEKRRKGIEIFQTILAGSTPEDAKKMMEEFEARQAQALDQLNKQTQAPAIQ